MTMYRLELYYILLSHRELLVNSTNKSMHVYLNRYTTDNSSLIYYTLGHSSHDVSQKKSVQYFIRFYRAVALFFFITSTSQSKFLFVFFFLTHPL